MFELTYIHHDCFLLRTKELGIVFDYWFDPTDTASDVPPFVRDFPKDLPLYVLVSHFHKDHFNKAIFRWAEVHPDIHYVISRDVARQVRYMLNPLSRYAGAKVAPEIVTVMSKLEIYTDSLLTIQTFGSTDIGNSYAITIKSQNLKVFHAGDLNCWAWRDESTPEEVASAERAFRSEMRPIADAFPEFDVAMFPVDSRIGTGYDQGAAIFTRMVNVKRFFPMHFTLADDAEMLEQRRRDAVAFKRYAPDRGEFIGLTEPYDTYSDEDRAISRAIHHKEEAMQYSHSWFLSAGDTNAEREMSLTLLTSKLIDISTAHANSIGIGNPFMPNDHTGWVLSRLTVEMADYPLVDSRFRIDTWVERWNRHYSERDFCICDEAGNPFGYARSIWMVLDTVTHANAGLDSLPFREEYISSRDCPIQRPGKHRIMMLPSELKGDESRIVMADSKPALYTFAYSDLDAYRHVNTVRYVTLLMNQFSLQEHDDFRVERMELSFLDEGAYGMTVEILRTEVKGDSENMKITDFMLRDRSDRHPILYARLYLKRRVAPIASL